MGLFRLVFESFNPFLVYVVASMDNLCEHVYSILKFTFYFLRTGLT